VDKQKVTAAFNEWMRRYTDEPGEFSADFQTASEFLAQRAAGEEPSYGAVCVEYLERLIAQLK
jgi:hypothetical protein